MNVGWCIRHVHVNDNTRQRARVVYEQNNSQRGEAMQFDYQSFFRKEGQLSNCFSKNQLVRQNIILNKQTETTAT